MSPFSCSAVARSLSFFKSLCCRPLGTMPRAGLEIGDLSLGLSLLFALLCTGVTRTHQVIHHVYAGKGSSKYSELWEFSDVFESWMPIPIWLASPTSFGLKI